MMMPICFSCHEELHYISNRRMMCWNATCEKIYGMNYACATCSAKKQLKVLMEVVAPGEVCCPLCGNKRDAPELNLETMMRDETIARLGSRGQARLRSIPDRTSTGPGRAASRIGTHRVTRQADSIKYDIFSSTKPRAAEKKDAFLHHEFFTFPERSESYIEETNNSMTIIVEFPRHTLEQIQWHKENTKLIIKSNIITCPYSDEITLPNWVEEPSEINLLNGFLTIRFTK